MWRAYIDESESDRRSDPNTYILATALVHDDHQDEVRADFRRLLRSGQRKLHWHAESGNSREAIIKTITVAPVLHVVVVREGRTDEPVERRRRKCLERLAYELHGREIQHLTVEARETKQNARELRHFSTLRASKTIGASMRLSHVPGPSEPLLWIPDAVAGAVAAHRTGTPRYLELLHDVIDFVRLENT